LLHHWLALHVEICGDMSMILRHKWFDPWPPAIGMWLSCGTGLHYGGRAAGRIAARRVRLQANPTAGV
jgi:hypothetical protein